MIKYVVFDQQKLDSDFGFNNKKSLAFPLQMNPIYSNEKSKDDKNQQK